MEKDQVDKAAVPALEEEKKLLADKPVNDDYHTHAFSEELSDGGERNKIAEAQLNRGIEEV